MPAPTDQEQYLLELINEARLDPLKNAMRYLNSYAPLNSSDPDIQDGIEFFNVGGSALLTAFESLDAVAPLAWNNDLADAAHNHSAAMIAADEEAKQVPGEEGLGDRFEEAGYLGFTRLAENVTADAESVLYGHASLMIDWGNGPNGMQLAPSQRNTIMWGDLTEIGIDITAEIDPSTQVGPFVITQDFGDRDQVFVLGVAYDDDDGDNFYSIGEGRNDLTVEWGTSATTTTASGGYSLAITPGEKTIKLTGGGLAGELLVTTTIASDNLKLDVVNGDTLLTSGWVDVEGPVSVIRAVGALSFGFFITAGDGDQEIHGNIGRDNLKGGDGNDKLFGYGQRDTLYGENGNDEIHPGAGDDTVVGGAGDDTVVYDGNRSAYSVSSPSSGTIVISGNGTGTDTITSTEFFRFDDGDYTWNQSQEQLVFVQPNQNPEVSASQLVTTTEDVTATITVSGTDPDGDTLTYTAGAPGHGSVTGGSGGVFSYLPDSDFVGSDSFVVTVNDGRGGTVLHTVNIMVVPLNSAPTVAASQQISTDEDTTAQFTVSGNDPDGDTLSYSAGAASHGTVTGGAGGNFSYTPDTDFNGSDSFTVMVEDGNGGSATQTVTVTVAPLNDTPDVASNQVVTTSQGTAKPVFIGASDADGDTLNYVAGAAENGSVSGGNGGVFTYTPDAGFSGNDSFTVTVDDGNGGTSNQVVSLMVAAAEDTPAALKLFASDGFAGATGGTGTIFGSNAFQDIALADQPDDYTFDASFNQGGDVIRFSGNANAYYIALSGSTAILDNGDSSYTIPVGKTGVALVFADGVRTLRFDETASEVKVGSQIVDGVFAAITAPDDGTNLPNGAIPTADARVFLSEGSEMSAGGNQTVFGTGAGEEDVNYISGDLILDASFNKGGDTLHLSKPANHYSAYLSGTKIVLLSEDGTITIPVGTVGMTLEFAGNSYLLRFDTTSGTIKIGDSDVTATSEVDALPVGVSGSGGAGDLDVGGPANQVSINLDSETAHLLIDDAGQTTNVLISGFDDDDQILVTGAEASDYSFSRGDADNDSLADDLEIAYQDGVIVNLITILDVATSAPFVLDANSAIENVGWNFIDFA